MTQLLFDLCGLAAALASTPGKAVWEVRVSELQHCSAERLEPVYAQKLINREKAQFAPAGLRARIIATATRTCSWTTVSI